MRSCRFRLSLHSSDIQSFSVSASAEATKHREPTCSWAPFLEGALGRLRGAAGCLEERWLQLTLRASLHEGEQGVQGG